MALALAVLGGQQREVQAAPSDRLQALLLPAFDQFLKQIAQDVDLERGDQVLSSFEWLTHFKTRNRRVR